MQITEIKKIGKSDNYKIYLDNSYFLTLNIHTIYTYHLTVDMDIEKDTLEKVQFEGEKLMAFDKAVAFISKGSKTVKELRDYLKKKGYLEQVCEYVIQKLQEYKYINDEEYAKMFVQDKKNYKGKLMLKQLLMQKGIDSHVIDKILNGLNQTEEINLISEKYMKNKDKTKENKQKLYRYLLSRGFTYEETINATNKYFKESMYDWN